MFQLLDRKSITVTTIFNSDFTYFTNRKNSEFKKSPTSF